jgi:hypothetical protein
VSVPTAQLPYEDENKSFQKLRQVMDKHRKITVNIVRSDSFTITLFIRGSVPCQGKQIFISSKVANPPPDTPLQA